MKSNKNHEKSKVPATGLGIPDSYKIRNVTDFPAYIRALSNHLLASFEALEQRPIGFQVTAHRQQEVRGFDNVASGKIILATDEYLQV